jgi:Carboxypeptidase regulatory-like domain
VIDIGVSCNRMEWRDGMITWARVTILCAAALFGFGSYAPPAFAQSASATTAAIDGTVTDTSGAALPGVSVTVSSPALQGTRSAVTSAEGVYRLPQLPPGEYRIAYELAGFGTIVREKQQLAVGFNATINVQLQVSALQETITVQGESPVVDQKASKIVTNYDAEKLASLPSSRDIWSIMAVSPAVQVQRVDVGGSTAGTQTGYSSYDTKADQHRPMIEGIVMTEGTSAAGFYYDYGSFSEVSVGTGSHSADMGWPGVATSFVSKSGGNAYHGRLYADYQNGDIQSFNIDADQAKFLTTGGGLEAKDLNRIVRYYDLNGDVGGYVKKDALWWYGSLRNQQIDVRYTNFPVKPFVTELTNYTGKGTYTLNPNNKFIGYGQWGKKAQPNRLDYYTTSSSAALHSSEDSTWNQALLGHVWKGEWNSVLSSSAFAEARVGEFGYVWTNNRYGNSPAFQDLGNNQVRGSNRDWGQNITRDQALGSVSFFKDNWLGSHNFKIGGEVFRETIDYLRGLDDGDGTSFPGNVLQVLRNGAPIEVYLFGAPARSINGLWTYAGYVSDNWQLSNRLTMNLGLRFDRYRGFLPEQGRAASTFFPDAVTVDAVSSVFSWNLMSPRVGINYDLFGDGKTIVKFNYGQYWWNPGTALAGNVNTNPPDTYRRYAWSDLNSNGVWDQGEQSTLLGSAGGVGSASIDPNIKDTFTREVAAWVDRELMPNFGIRTGVVYRRIDQQYQVYNPNRPYDAYTVPVTIQDPGPDGRAGTSDDGGTFQGYNLNPANLALPNLSVVSNGPGVSEFWTYELTGTKRMSSNWSMLATFSYRWNNDFSTGYFGNTLRPTNQPLLLSPNDLINTDEGRYKFNTYAFKLTGTYDGPWGMRFAPSYRNQSGQPFGRTFLATMNYGSQRVLAEPIDSQRMRNINVVDLRVEKSIAVGLRKIGLVVDVYNITNANTEQNINWSSGTTYLAPSNIIGPRIVRFGGRFDW